MTWTTCPTCPRQLTLQGQDRQSVPKGVQCPIVQFGLDKRQRHQHVLTSAVIIADGLDGVDQPLAPASRESHVFSARSHEFAHLIATRRVTVRTVRTTRGVWARRTHGPGVEGLTHVVPVRRRRFSTTNGATLNTMNFSLRLALMRADVSLRELALASQIERTRLTRGLRGDLALSEAERDRVVAILGDFNPWEAPAAPQTHAEATA